MCCLDYDRTHIVRNKWGQVSSNSGSWLLPRAMFKSHSNLKWIETGGGRQVDLSPCYLGKISLSQRNYKVCICLLDPFTMTSMDYFFFFFIKDMACVIWPILNPRLRIRDFIVALTVWAWEIFKTAFVRSETPRKCIILEIC